MHVWKVKKIGEDRYHIVCKSVPLDEEVNGAQFMGMLNAKHLKDSDINTVLFDFDIKDVGYETGIIFGPEPAPIAAS